MKPIPAHCAIIAGIPETRQYQHMPIRVATQSDIQDWVELRAQLWDDTSLDQQRDEAAVMLAKSPEECIVFLDVVDGSGIRAFAEAALRHDHVNGCETSPVYRTDVDVFANAGRLAGHPFYYRDLSDHFLVRCIGNVQREQFVNRCSMGSSKNC